MSLEDLTHELHAQAAEVLHGPSPGIGDLRARRTRQRRRRAAGGAVAAVLLVALGALLLPGAPGDPGPAGDGPGPAGTTTASPSSPTGWRPVRCNRPETGGCAVPATLTYDDRTYVDRVGGVQPLFARNGVNRELRLSTRAAPDPRLLLVGATGAGPGSDLEVTVGAGPVRHLPGGRLTVLLLPRMPRAEDVVVRETGTPARGEQLRIEGYALAPG